MHSQITKKSKQDLYLGTQGRGGCFSYKNNVLLFISSLKCPSNEGLYSEISDVSTTDDCE